MKPEHEELCASLTAWAHDERLGSGPLLFIAIAAIRELSAEVERVAKENDTLRGLLGNSAKPCPYCGLAAEDQAKCASGFPGCARADDQMLSKHFADGYRAERAEAELASLRERLKDAEKDAERYQWILHQGPITDFIFKYLKSYERHVSNAIDAARKP